MRKPIRFLSLEQVLQLHETSLAHFGGIAGIRDQKLLEAALAMPAAQFGGDFLHPGPAEMAAAYLYHIAMSHAFLDGNKRTACFAAVVFLDANGIEHDITPQELETVTLQVASGQMDKPALTKQFQVWLRRR